MNELDINVECCRARQRRLLAEMRQKNLDWIVVQKTEHVQWLTGPRFAWLFEAAAVMASDGRTTLVAPRQEPVVAADELLTYEASRYSTLAATTSGKRARGARSRPSPAKPKPLRIGMEG